MFIGPWWSKLHSFKEVCWFFLTAGNFNWCLFPMPIISGEETNKRFTGPMSAAGFSPHVLQDPATRVSSLSSQLLQLIHFCFSVNLAEVFFSEKEMEDEHPGHLWKWWRHSARITSCRSNPIKLWKCPRILCELDFCSPDYLLKALKRPFQFPYILPLWEAAVGYLHSRHLRGRTIAVV